MSLDSIAKGFQRFIELAKPGPTRYQLVIERDALLAEPPPAPASTLTDPAPLTCRCETCLHAAHEEQTKRHKYLAWAGRIQRLEGQLFKMTWGDEKERDAAGDDLAELIFELRTMMDVNLAIPWERRIVRNAFGKEISAHEVSADVLGAIHMTLLGLYREANERLIYLNAEDLASAITETRARAKAAIETPVKRTIPIDAAKRAGTQVARTEGDVERAGLRPGLTPNVLEGSVRFKP